MSRRIAQIMVFVAILLLLLLSICWAARAGREILQYLSNGETNEGVFIQFAVGTVALFVTSITFFYIFVAMDMLFSAAGDIVDNFMKGGGRMNRTRLTISVDGVEETTYYTKRFKSVYTVIISFVGQA